MTRSRIIIATLIASLAGCGPSEAERACYAIQATGVAATPTNYVGCDPSRAGVCGSLDCWRLYVARASGLCSQTCRHDTDCAGTAGPGRDVYCHVGHCLPRCAATAPCPIGTTCGPYAFRGTSLMMCLPVDCPP